MNFGCASLRRSEPLPNPEPPSALPLHRPGTPVLFPHLAPPPHRPGTPPQRRGGSVDLPRPAPLRGALGLGPTEERLSACDRGAGKGGGSHLWPPLPEGVANCGPSPLLQLAVPARCCLPDAPRPPPSDPCPATRPRPRAPATPPPPPSPWDRESPPSRNALEWIGLRQSLIDPSRRCHYHLSSCTLYNHILHTHRTSGVSLHPLGPTTRSALGKEAAFQ